MDTHTRKYPLNYSRDIQTMINMLCFPHQEEPHIVGTAGLKLDFVSDYDLYQKVSVTNPSDVLHQFQTIIRNLLKTPLVYIGDIKSGEIPEFKILDNTITVDNYNSKLPAFIQKLTQLYTHGIITPAEYGEAKKRFVPNLTETEIALLKKEIRYEVMRWTPKDILRGFLNYRTRRVRFEDYLLTDSFTKIDITLWLNGVRYNEMSMIYLFKVNGKEINNFFNNIVNIIREQVLILLSQQKYFKTCKRIYTLERIKSDELQNKPLIKSLLRLFNSDLGRISQIISDLEALEYLIENHKLLPKQRIEFELDQMRNRLGLISNNEFIQSENIVYRLLNLISTGTPNLKEIDKLKKILNQILQHQTYLYIKSIGLTRMPREYVGLNVIGENEYTILEPKWYW